MPRPLLNIFTVALLASGLMTTFATAQVPTKQDRPDAFRQLDELLPTPGETRTASGAPGHRYWQQKVDYTIEATLDEASRRIDGREQIHYHNHSPDTLRYLWVQLDNNRFRPDSLGRRAAAAPALKGRMSWQWLHRQQEAALFDGGIELAEVSADGEALHYVVVDTMMRVDLPAALAPGKTFRFTIAWSYTVNDSALVGGRTGAEYFEEDKNWIFEISHWFPRLAVYDDVNGWQNKAFLGSGEFALEFGDYDVRLTVPADHIVAATGVLQNREEILTPVQMERWERAMEPGNDGPTMIVTLEEAIANEGLHQDGHRTWHFQADNVRDFAWASSRKFLWDCWGVWSGDRERDEGHIVAAMSFWPKEGEPMWSKFSTQAIVHTLEVYSRYTFEYPYPSAISVNGPVGGMEYPMICFNGPRPEKDGTYSERTKYGLIGVVIHEVGHNFFPMIVNSDERQWTWMDEGLNTFVQHLAEVEWDDHYRSYWGEPSQIVGYMLSEEQVPIMTNSESLLSFGNNAYGKPMTALNILRDTVIGRELFDFAFQEYARRWKFKHPKPADFFRTMEDASGVDLDWFWHGWFYTTDHVDIALSDVQWYQISTQDPLVEKEIQRDTEAAVPVSRQKELNLPLPLRVNAFPELKDFYDSYDPFAVLPSDLEAYDKLRAGLDAWQQAQLDSPLQFYVLSFDNLGGLVMPLILELQYQDGSREIQRIPAEIWRKNSEHTTKLVVTDRPLAGIVLDPKLETADADLDNNFWPPATPQPSRFDLFEQQRRGGGSNPMRDARQGQSKVEGQR